jgi:hypothetical protein
MLPWPIPIEALPLKQNAACSHADSPRCSAFIPILQSFHFRSSPNAHTLNAIRKLALRATGLPRLRASHCIALHRIRRTDRLSLNQPGIEQ